MNEDERKKSTGGDVSWKTERATLTVECGTRSRVSQFHLYPYPYCDQVMATGRHARGLTIRRLKSHWLGGVGSFENPFVAGWLVG